MVSCAVEWCQNMDTRLTVSLHVLRSAAIRRIGEDTLDAPCEQQYPARRWAIAWTRAWRSTCRGLLMRYGTTAVQDLGLRPLAGAGMGVQRRGHHASSGPPLDSSTGITRRGGRGSAMLDVAMLSAWLARHVAIRRTWPPARQRRLAGV
jgi:hypothetical protein